ncbi:MAG: hypothetical protein HY903_11030 [Deltaproteobacteria bacterium]|nr:hypothetical protein [Deltaproteobacteria bacterium]
MAVSSPSILAWLKAHPALRPAPALRAERLSTGQRPLDALLQGGLPCGAITEIVGRASSGRTSLALGAMAAVTAAGALVAWIDPFDTLDPLSAQASGVVLEQLLWIRPRGADAVAQALAATGQVVAAGGFAALALDVAEGGRRAPLCHLGTWVRLKHRLERSRTVLLLLSGDARAGAMAALRLECAWAPEVARLRVRVTRQWHGTPGAEVLLPLAAAVD